MIFEHLSSWANLLQVLENDKNIIFASFFFIFFFFLRPAWILGLLWDVPKGRRTKDTECVRDRGLYIFSKL
jgi:hypothetical protein